MFLFLGGTLHNFAIFFYLAFVLDSVPSCKISAFRLFSLICHALHRSKPKALRWSHLSLVALGVAWSCQIIRRNSITLISSVHTDERPSVWWVECIPLKMSLFFTLSAASDVKEMGHTSLPYYLYVINEEYFFSIDGFFLEFIDIILVNDNNWFDWIHRGPLRSKTIYCKQIHQKN